MIRSQIEREIIKAAKQVNLREPRNARHKKFENIFDDFFSNIDFANKHYLDLGPGHWDFAELAVEHGADGCDGVDNDPAILELGKVKGFQGKLHDLKTPLPMDFPRYDGIFLKFSISSLWWSNGRELHKWTKALLCLLKPDGWLWLAPWNTGMDAQNLFQKIIFHALGMDVRELTKEEAVRYGANGKTTNRALFTIGLS